MTRTTLHALSFCRTRRESSFVPGLVPAELDYWCRKLSIEAAWLTFLEDFKSGAWRVECRRRGKHV